MESGTSKKADLSIVLSEDDRRKLIEKAQQSLPELDQKFERAIGELERISLGLPRS